MIWSKYDTLDSPPVMYGVFDDEDSMFEITPCKYYFIRGFIFDFFDKRSNCFKWPKERPTYK